VAVQCIRKRSRNKPKWLRYLKGKKGSEDVKRNNVWIGKDIWERNHLGKRVKVPVEQEEALRVCRIFCLRYVAISPPPPSPSWDDIPLRGGRFFFPSFVNLTRKKKTRRRSWNPGVSANGRDRDWEK
jgi:hypothetical protein